MATIQTKIVMIMDPNINPERMEIPNNLIDEDCDEALIIDNDMDGYNSDMKIVMMKIQTLTLKNRDSKQRHRRRL
ncbi:MAG: hypothetical protein R2784_05910 [Saprospiraceae bacterium]